MTILTNSIAVRLTKLQAKRSLSIGVHKVKCSTLVLQRMCRWVNLMHNVALLRLSECFDSHLISLSLATSKNAKAN